MNIYLASRYNRLHEMEEVAAVLRGMGHTITSRWHRGEHEAADYLAGTNEGIEMQRLCANDDIDDLYNAECVVNFAEPLLGRGTPSRGGRLVEQGLAIGLEKWCIKVGGRETVFDALPCIYHVADTAELYQVIGEAAC